jgi:hypothetical protein
MEHHNFGAPCAMMSAIAAKDYHRQLPSGEKCGGMHQDVAGMQLALVSPSSSWDFNERGGDRVSSFKIAQTKKSGD